MAKIMLVEDDNNLREIYEARLQAEGYTIVSAKDGEEALVVAKAENPDLVISDVMMPKISGFEMLDILRNTDGLKEVKVIMLTALGQSDDQQRADKLGADRYLVKSQVTLEDIVKVTHDLLEGEAVPPTAAAEPTTAPTETPTPDPTPVVATPVVPVATPPQNEPSATATVPAVPAEEPKTENITAPEPVPEPAKPEEPSTEPVNKPAEPLTVTTEASPEPAKPDATVEAAAPTTAVEEASVEAKIEDFVAGATTEPTTPSDPSPVPATAEPASIPAPTVTTDEQSKQVDNDKLTSDAVDALVASTDKNTQTAEAEIIPEPKLAAETSATDNTEATTDIISATTPEPKAVEESTGGGSTSHNKVIEPIDSEPKKDLEVLLAQEAAKEASTAPVTTATPVVVADGDKQTATAETIVSAPPKDPTKPDLNDIAL